jgi:hypothetical protein
MGGTSASIYSVSSLNHDPQTGNPDGFHVLLTVHRNISVQQDQQDAVCVSILL